MWDLQYIIAQGMTIIGSILLSITFFTKDKKLILILSCLSTVMYCINYLLLGAYTGMIMNLVAMFRVVWFYINEKLEKDNEYISLIVCSILIVVSGIITYASWADILVILAMVLYTYSVWQKSIAFYRWSGIACSIGWIIYNFLCSALFANITEAIMMVVKIVGIIKLYTHKHTDKQSETNYVLEQDIK